MNKMKKYFIIFTGTILISTAFATSVFANNDFGVTSSINDFNSPVFQTANIFNSSLDSSSQFNFLNSGLGSSNLQLSIDNDNILELPKLEGFEMNIPSNLNSGENSSNNNFDMNDYIQRIRILQTQLQMQKDVENLNPINSNNSILENQDSPVFNFQSFELPSFEGKENNINGLFNSDMMNGNVFTLDQMNIPSINIDEMQFSVQNQQDFSQTPNSFLESMDLGFNQQQINDFVSNSLSFSTQFDSNEMFNNSFNQDLSNMFNNQEIPNDFNVNDSSLDPTAGFSVPSDTSFQNDSTNTNDEE